ncbi:MAG: hypothetical protein WBM14_12190, partial [Terracidiphilus sp.]
MSPRVSSAAADCTLGYFRRIPTGWDARSALYAGSGIVLARKGIYSTTNSFLAIARAAVERVKQSIHGVFGERQARALHFDSFLPLEVHVLQLCVGGVPGQ